MAMGVCMKAFNTIYFGHYSDFVLEFCLQIIMLLAMFGFMDLLIIVKWLTNWPAMTDGVPPSVITMMIDMFLHMGVPSTYYTQLFPN
mmetsp:Transcript_21917/g.16262  ORF Transcript_21917/g.16262 Transcript_21917/m.16262 type:complete len:87 (+) Transcript_21917:376-636(+)